MYALERESNYTPLYKKYFYKKGTIITTLRRSDLTLLTFPLLLLGAAAHVNMIGADPTLGPIGTHTTPHVVALARTPTRSDLTPSW